MLLCPPKTVLLSLVEIKILIIVLFQLWFGDFLTTCKVQVPTGSFNQDNNWFGNIFDRNYFIWFLVDLPLNLRSRYCVKYRRLFLTCFSCSYCWPSSCSVLCFQGSKVQTRVGLLMLLCTWISNCPIAVTHFLHNQENVPFVSFYELTAIPKLL